MTGPGSPVRQGGEDVTLLWEPFVPSTYDLTWAT